MQKASKCSLLFLLTHMRLILAWNAYVSMQQKRIWWENVQHAMKSLSLYSEIFVGLCKIIWSTAVWVREQSLKRVMVYPNVGYVMCKNTCKSILTIPKAMSTYENLTEIANFISEMGVKQTHHNMERNINLYLTCQDQISFWSKYHIEQLMGTRWKTKSC